MPQDESQFTTARERREASIRAADAAREAAAAEAKARAEREREEAAKREAEADVLDAEILTMISPLAAKLRAREALRRDPRTLHPLPPRTEPTVVERQRAIARWEPLHDDIRFVADFLRYA
jgi:hypothetical protein